MTGVTYDTGALIAAERNDRAMWALHKSFLAEDEVPTVPAPVVAEAWRGGSRQANLARFLALCTVEDLTGARARDVGVLVGISGHDDVVDVFVAEGAMRRGDTVVASNPTHIRTVADAANGRLHIEVV